MISLEVEMIGKAHRMGLLTTPYAFNRDEAVEMAKAGADIIVAHMGLTTSGSIGAKTALSLEESVIRVQEIADAALRIKPNTIVLCHGGIWKPFDLNLPFYFTHYIDCRFLLQESNSFGKLLFTGSIKLIIVTLMQFSGPISGPEEAEFILKRTTGVHGFYGASSMERLPVEQAITSTIQQYKSIPMK